MDDCKKYSKIAQFTYQLSAAGSTSTIRFEENQDPIKNHPLFYLITGNKIRIFIEDQRFHFYRKKCASELSKNCCKQIGLSFLDTLTQLPKKTGKFNNQT